MLKPCFRIHIPTLCARVFCFLHFLFAFLVGANHKPDLNNKTRIKCRKGFKFLQRKGFIIHWNLPQSPSLHYLIINYCFINLFCALIILVYNHLAFCVHILAFIRLSILWGRSPALCPTQFLAHFFAMNVVADDERREYQKKMMSAVLEEMKSLCEALWIPPGHPLVFSVGVWFPERASFLHEVDMCIMDSLS